MQIMISQVLATALLVCLVHSQQLPIFDLSTCHNMCKGSNDCPSNAACLPLFGSTQCGVCSCVIGYSPTESGNDCRPNGRTTAAAESSTTLTDESQESTSQEEATLADAIVNSVNESAQEESSSMALKTDTEANLNPASAIIAPRSKKSDPDPTFRCPTKNPECDPNKAQSDDPFTIKVVELDEDCLSNDLHPIDCPNNIGTNDDCSGGSTCFEIVKNHNTCLCPYDRAGPSCRTLKPDSHCTNGNSTILSQLKETPGKRLVHQKIPLTGAIYARHIVPNVQHCAKLCEWSGGLRCRSFNFGRINGINVCELMSITSESELLKDWLVNDANFTHYCCYKFAL